MVLTQSANETSPLWTKPETNVNPRRHDSPRDRPPPRANPPSTGRDRRLPLETTLNSR